MRTLKITALAALLLSLAGCDLFDAAKSQVYQGQCISVDASQLILANNQPKLNHISGEKAVFNLAGAKVGLTPAPGDTMRVAYVDADGGYRALKVMNVTKQDLRKK